MNLRVKLDDGTVQTVECEVEERADGEALRIFFPYHLEMKDEVKIALNARWGEQYKADPQKCWDAPINARTDFRLAAMQWAGLKDGKPVAGKVDPFWRYRLPLEYLPCPPRRYKGEITPYYGHQPGGVAHVWTKRRCVLGYDMGTGKTLIIGRTMEECKARFGWKDEDFWYVCKKGALYQVILDYMEWEIGVKPIFMSYDDMKNAVAGWPKGKPAPRFVVFDESTQIKTPSSERSKQALHLANSMRSEYGDDCFIVPMTGSPAPKNPTDWWHQVEVPCPGFIREGSRDHFDRRLSVGERRQNEDGGVYRKRGGWLDDDKKCKICANFIEHEVHSKEQYLAGVGHSWVASVNEILGVYSRLKPIVDIKHKKDCLDLPERTHRVIRLKPTMAMKNAAKLIAAKSSGAAQALTLLRELSDGFQYVEVPVGTKVCGMCSGSKTMVYKYNPEHPFEPANAFTPDQLVEGIKDCDECSGAGEVDIVKRTVSRVSCPKDDVIEELLEEHQDIGRLPIYAGFTGSVDRVVDICLKNDWYVIRVDSRGWKGLAPNGKAPLPAKGEDLYSAFRYKLDEFKKVAFVAQASTAAHGLNFEVCPTIVYFSNDFNWENRTQGDERNLRGKIRETLKKHNLSKVTVVDIVHLESDAFVLENHSKKRKLQALTMGDVQLAMAKETYE